MSERNSAVLLLIDVQRAFWTGNQLVRNAFPAFPEQITALLASARASGLEIGSRTMEMRFLRVSSPRSCSVQ